MISPALKGKAGSSPLILSPDCTNCGRCIDVCAMDVFNFTHRFDDRLGDDPELSTVAANSATVPDNGSTQHANTN